MGRPQGGGGREAGAQHHSARVAGAPPRPGRQRLAMEADLGRPSIGSSGRARSPVVRNVSAAVRTRDVRHVKPETERFQVVGRVDSVSRFFPMTKREHEHRLLRRNVAVEGDSAGLAESDHPFPQLRLIVERPIRVRCMLQQQDVPLDRRPGARCRLPVVLREEAAASIEPAQGGVGDDTSWHTDGSSPVSSARRGSDTISRGSTGSIRLAFLRQQRLLFLSDRAEADHPLTAIHESSWA